MTNLSKVSTYDLIDALKDRKDVEYVVNERSSAATYVSVDFKRGFSVDGESITINVKGLY